MDERLSNDSATEIEDTNGKITLDTVIEPEGTNLSLGQRSLLSLARALVKDSRVVILDEATLVFILLGSQLPKESLLQCFSRFGNR